MPILLMLHVLAVVLWVGGMFFAYMILRPVAGELLPPPQRLPLWLGVLKGFFVWVWIAIAAILLSGFGMIPLLGGFGSVGWHVHAMLLIGLVMMAIFAHLFFAPFSRLRQRVAAEQWTEAGAALAGIRKLVGTNLILGLLVIVIATAGRGLA